MKIIRMKQQRGLTLVELMVSLAIGLVILLGIMSIFTANRETYSIQESLGQLQENGQYAINFVARQLRRSGYFPNPPLTPGNKTLYETQAFNGVQPVSANHVFDFFIVGPGGQLTTQPLGFLDKYFGVLLFIHPIKLNRLDCLCIVLKTGHELTRIFTKEK